jgi:hypothetical protein
MIYLYLFSPLLICIFYSLVLYNLSEVFRPNLKIIKWFILPLFVYCLGYTLRLSENSKIIDIGFLLCDTTSIFVSLIFAFILVLGQIKYWGH